MVPSKSQVFLHFSCYMISFYLHQSTRFFHLNSLSYLLKVLKIAEGELGRGKGIVLLDEICFCKNAFTRFFILLSISSVFVQLISCTTTCLSSSRQFSDFLHLSTNIVSSYRLNVSPSMTFDTTL